MFEALECKENCHSLCVNRCHGLCLTHFITHSPSYYLWHLLGCWLGCTFESVLLKIIVPGSVCIAITVSPVQSEQVVSFVVRIFEFRKEKKGR